MQILNLKQLEAFCAVVDCGGFTAASQSLYLAQSTISGHVSALERDLGVALLTRTGKKSVSLTPEGRRVYAHAKTILQSCQELSGELAEQTSHELVIAASSIPMQYILPRLTAEYLAADPACRLILRDGDSREVHDALLSGRAHVGFAGAMLESREITYDLIAEDPLVLVAPDTEEYRALRDAGTEGNALLSRPLLFREGGSGTQVAGARFLADNGICPQDLCIVARIENSEALLRAVGCGMGCAVVSALAAESARGVISFPLVGKSNSRPLYMLRPRTRRMTAAARDFAAFVLRNKSE